jgi:uncharacterized protein YqeY
MVDEQDAGGLRQRLRDELRTKMKQRDQAAVAVLRTALGIIDNAEAADLSVAPEMEPGHIAGGVAGLGAGEVPRQSRSDDELVEMLLREIERWEETARECERAGRSDDAARLQAEIGVLRPFLDLR